MSSKDKNIIDFITVEEKKYIELGKKIKNGNIELSKIKYILKAV